MTAGPERGSHSSFADRLQEAIDRKRSCLVVGLDPTVERLPAEVQARVRGRIGDIGWTAHAATACALFLDEVITAVADVAVAVKPNTAFFERFGAVGWDCLLRLCTRARQAGLLVIADAKRGDVGHTAEAYAEAFLGAIPDTLGVVTDAVTLHPWTGSDGVQPFLERVRDDGKGIFILVRTSNPSAAEIQDLEVEGEPVFERVARLVRGWGEGLEGECGLNPVGAVVGATAPEQAARARAVLDRAFLLVPGLGTQGGSADALARLFLPGGRGVIVNASRSILYAHESAEGPWQDAVARAARSTREELERVRERTG